MTDEPGVVARWEWRTFGDDLGAAGERLAAMTPERVSESEETYLLSVDAEASVKLRDGVLDVKVLQRVDDDGLQQWRPVLKVSEPFGPDDVRAALAALGAASLQYDEAETSFGRFVEEVVDPARGLAAVPVHKRRRHLTVGGCKAELTDVRTGRAETRSIVIEGEDPALVIAAVRELDLASRPNVSFPHGLAVLAGFGARRFAVVDVGTNSIKFHVAERAADGTWRAIADGAEVTRLGEGLHESGRLGDEPIARTAAALADVAEQVRGHDVEALAAVGTAGLRIASNSDAFLDAARERAGVEVEVISGEEEARLAFVAVTAGLDLGAGQVVVFDTGGGSSQFTFASAGRIEEQFSVNVGAARIAERFGLAAAVSEETVAAVLAALASELEPIAGRPVPEAIVGLGGAVTNMAAVKLGLEAYDPEAVQGTVLDRADIDVQLELYRSRDAEERRAIAGLQPKRAEVILAGACIVRTVLEQLGRDSLTVSDRGLRHGLIVERFGL